VVLAANQAGNKDYSSAPQVTARIVITGGSVSAAPDYSQLKGDFNGLIGTGSIMAGGTQDTQAFSSSNGFIKITMGTLGSISAQINIENGTYTYSGRFGADKKATPSVVTLGSLSAVLDLGLVSALPGEINGKLSYRGRDLPLRALHGVATGGTINQSYTIKLPAPDGAPLAAGSANLSVSGSGTNILVGKLATGESFSCSAVLVDSGDGNWVFPVYAEILGGGLITGEIVIPKAPPVAGQGTLVPDVTGGIEWVRLPKSNENYPILRSGFVIHFDVVGTKK
jgi:hypothetical protein